MFYGNLYSVIRSSSIISQVRKNSQFGVMSVVVVGMSVRNCCVIERILVAFSVCMNFGIVSSFHTIKSDFSPFPFVIVLINIFSPISVIFYILKRNTFIEYKYLQLNGLQIKFRYIMSKEKKEEIWLSPMTKAPTPAELSKGQDDNTKNATKKFDYTAVADRPMMVS